MDGPLVCAACRLHPVDWRFRPFCSRRCQQGDLARWADGTYRVPGPAADLDDQPDDDRSDDDN
ncbi:MAG: DNA gyrase inhibitor YacG [Acidobacteria bacterium]|nr:DNA gyrase inhibitor YacG [Acidobacteriota bacterium]